MILSASYNFFNGDEHLLASLKTIRPHVDHISIVSQDTSNLGRAMTGAARIALREAVDQGLVDRVFTYSPDLSKPAKQNEIRKRAVGLNIARKAQATHFLNLDADEFYRPAEIEFAKQQIQVQGWHSTSVNSYLHIRRPVWRALDITCCCFITKIEPDTRMGAKDFPCDHVDPSRRMTAQPKTHHHFEPDHIAMYHMNLVRRDIDEKLENSSTRDKGFLAEVRKAWMTWTPGTPFYFPNKGAVELDFVENEFNTFDPEDERQ